MLGLKLSGPPIVPDYQGPKHRGTTVLKYVLRVILTTVLYGCEMGFFSYTENGVLRTEGKGVFVFYKFYVHGSVHRESNLITV